MRRTGLIPIAIAVGALTAAAASVAQQAPQAPAGVTRPSTTLVQAVTTAEQQTKGRAAKVELEREDGVYVYEVKTISKDGPVEVLVNFATGKIESVEGRGFLARIGDVFDGDDRREDEAMLKALEASPVSLSKAITAAETNTGGRAVKAKMKDRYGRSYFEVALIVDGSKKRVQVDSATAKVIAVKARKDHDGDDHDKND